MQPADVAMVLRLLPSAIKEQRQPFAGSIRHT
jgi:hypothetical protein